MGYVRYDSPQALAAMNALYRQELRLFQNLFLPSVKLVRKERVGARVRRVYDHPQTPLERVRACPAADPVKTAQLQAPRERLDPFALSQAIDQQLARLYALAQHRPRPRSTGWPSPLSPVEQASAQALSQGFGVPVYIGTRPLAGRRRK
jgi:hypothetical protein